MKTNIYSTWFTKDQAAEAIGVSTKTVEKLAQDGKLQRAEWIRPEGGPRIVVYHPRDVKRIRDQRNPGAKPFVIQDPEVPESETALATIRAAGPDNLLEALQAVGQLIPKNAQKVASSELRLSERQYLTLQQASEYSGLGVGYLRRLIADGTLAVLKGAGPHRATVIRRKQLEQL